MKIRVQVLTDTGEPIGREFDTPSFSYWIALIMYAKLIELLTGNEPDDKPYNEPDNK